MSSLLLRPAHTVRTGPPRLGLLVFLRTSGLGGLGDWAETIEGLDLTQFRQATDLVGWLAAV
jgi:hypothetical protein